jgi:hypothetical protein
MKRLALLLALAGCDGGATAPHPAPPESVEGAASSVVPQPRALEPAVASATASASLGGAASTNRPTPAPLLAGERVAPEALPARGEAVKGDAPKGDASKADAGKADATRAEPARTELSGVDLDARWSWPRRPSGSAEDPRGKSAVDLQIRLVATGRMRLTLRTPTTPLAVGTELLGRSDRYGHLLVWPDRPEYRAIAPGMLRAVVDDRRFDATPLSKATSAELGESKRLGVPVRRVELTGSYGAVTLELARVREAGLGALVLCRTLVELGGIDPALAPCRAEPDPELPVAASYAWGTTEGKEALRLEVVRLEAHDKDAVPIAVPSPELTPRVDGVPSASAVLVTEEERAALGGKDAGAAKAASGKGGLSAQNRSDRTMFLLVDGLPAAVLAPRGRVRIDGLRPTVHRVEWRSFLADEGSPTVDAEPDAQLRYPQDAPEDEESEAR